MSRVYIDTSVLLARWAVSDPHHQASQKLLTAIQEEHIQATISTLTLLEVASVVGRQQAKFSDFLLTDLDLAVEYVKKIVEIKELEIVDTFFQKTRLQISNREIECSRSIRNALLMSSLVQLKSLDNLHLGIIITLNQSSAPSIDYFVTGDQGILTKREVIEQRLKIQTITATELLEIEGI